MTRIAEAKAVREVLSNHSIAWNVEYSDGELNLTIGCTSRDAAELLAESLNDAAWITAGVGEQLGRR